MSSVRGDPEELERYGTLVADVAEAVARHGRTVDDPLGSAVAGWGRRAGALGRAVAEVGAALRRADRGALVAADGVGPPGGADRAASLTARVAAVRAEVRAALAAEADPGRRRALRRLLADDPRTGRPRVLLAFDPSGEGQVVEAFGDLAHATAVGVYVPGMDSDLVHFDSRVASRARDLQRRAQRVAGPDARVATVAWLGYDAPDGTSLRDLRSSLEVARAGQAWAGGARLRAFLAGPAVPAAARTTVIGHSYGSTTVAAAVLRGARPDAVLVAGSPGVLVDRADELGPAGTERFTMEAPGDPVPLLERFGDDPNEVGSGWTRLETGGHGHSTYLRPGTTSLANAARVVAGRLDRLERRAPSPAERAGTWAADHAGSARPLVAVVHGTQELVDVVTGTARALHPDR